VYVGNRRSCTVSFTDPAGIRHSVTVTAARTYFPLRRFQNPEFFVGEESGTAGKLPCEVLRSITVLRKVWDLPDISVC
jgi:hypothetical protein